MLSSQNLVSNLERCGSLGNALPTELKGLNLFKSCQEALCSEFYDWLLMERKVFFIEPTVQSAKESKNKKIQR